MKHIDLLDRGGAPTDRYRRGLRGGDAGRRLVGEGIREGYKSLFDTYPDAYRQSPQALETFISAHSDLGGRALTAAVATFQAACTFGDFADGDDDSLQVISDEDEALDHPINKGSSGRDQINQVRDPKSNSGAVTINVNIALSVDATSDPSVYDAFFAAMAKHIKVLGEDGGSSHSS